MKMIGLIGGMSWESSLEYYRIINQEVKARLGGLHSAECLMVSVDFAEIEQYQRQGDWEQAGWSMAEASRRLARGGADCVVLCTNTMHKVTGFIENAVQIPLIHIADATALQIQRDGLHKVGLLGTRFTMEEEFYRHRLTTRFGLEVLIPDPESRRRVDEIIYHELVLGELRAESKHAYRKVIQHLVDLGAQGIIFGCTEIGLLVTQADSLVPVYDTTLIHARAAVDFALS